MFQRLRQRARNGVVWVQRRPRILKHHLHVAPQLALKASPGVNALPARNAAAPLALQPRQHAQNGRFPAAGFTDQAEGFAFLNAKLAAETAVFPRR
jgi:hypothetical protein